MTGPGLLAFGEAPSSVVHAQVLLTYVQTGPLALLADAAEVVALVLYALGVRRLRARGRAWPWWQTGCFALGILLVWVAVGSGLAAYDDLNVTMHVIQHLVLMMVAPPLLTAGRPLTLLNQAGSRATQVRLIGILRSRAVAVLTFPVVVWFLYYGSMYVFFQTGIYPYSVTHQLFHDVTHGWFLAVGYLYWQPIIGLDQARRQESYPVRLGLLFVGMPFEAFLGISIMGEAAPLAPINTLGNTHNAGAVFWALAEALTAAGMALVAALWFASIDRETAREDRRAPARDEANRARAAELGVELPEGATLPWWRLAELEAQAARRAGGGPEGGDRSAPA
ncbi:MAG TPA: cytochrome c oxidase assembly protein [Acidimicrobiales bacterium]|jgi:putative copper resistance protein D|nr:cytochrome c oxidase assembly protein [Acidimicrobiales bacterium]